MSDSSTSRSAIADDLRHRLQHDGPASEEVKANGSSSSSDPLMPQSRLYRATGSIPNTALAVSLISAALGGLLVVSLSLSALSVAGNILWWDARLGVYLGAMALFHLMEFWVTAAVNTERLSVDAFLLNNGSAYWVAHSVGLVEYAVRHLAPALPIPATLVRWATWWSSTGWLAIALPLLVTAQALRSLAMIHAAASFSHIVATSSSREASHTLVTTGVYSRFRHPSYTGFFYWAVATQGVLGNLISALGFAWVLGTFFSQRIQAEEYHLARYFSEYVEYRSRTGVWIPWPFMR